MLPQYSRRGRLLWSHARRTTRDSLSLPLPLSLCLCPSLSASQAAPPRPPRQPCLQTDGRRGALIKTRRAPHLPKGSIPAEGWASGWRGHPRRTTDSPPAARSPIAALPRPPAAPPRSHTARGERPRRGSRGLSPGDAAGLSRHGPGHRRPPQRPRPGHAQSRRGRCRGHEERGRGRGRAGPEGRERAGSRGGGVRGALTGTPVVTFVGEAHLKTVKLACLEVFLRYSRKV